MTLSSLAAGSPVCSKSDYMLQDNGNWYKASNQPSTHCEANVACNVDGARLTMLKTEEDVTIFNNLIGINLQLFNV